MMTTAKAAIAKPIPRRRPGGLSSRLRRGAPAGGLGKIKEMAEALLQEAELLDRDNALAEASAPNLSAGVDFFEQVRHFEIQLIRSALELTGGNQARAAQLLGLRASTLNYKIKVYGLLWRDAQA